MRSSLLVTRHSTSTDFPKKQTRTGRHAFSTNTTLSHSPVLGRRVLMYSYGRRWTNSGFVVWSNGTRLRKNGLILPSPSAYTTRSGMSGTSENCWISQLKQYTTTSAATVISMVDVSQVLTPTLRMIFLWDSLLECSQL
ncbi:unnamed protein product [Mycena citricolor]|uniref:Uncharacterized protein n=1 Tax=Mycena citricolor TaxID=2018698 RepID=A0AAD2HMT6_9AGAR|nr:unnamed protein product [Mycena citricolor]